MSGLHTDQQDWFEIAAGLLSGHAAVRSVVPAGSRSRGTHDRLSDWDLAVETTDFETVARDLSALVTPLEPLGQQWEPMGHFPVYQVLLRGPVKIEYLFLDQRQEPRPAATPSKDTLAAIDNHFWDWIWWITTKASIGRDDLVVEHLTQLHTHLLRPLDARDVATGIQSAVETFVDRRDAVARDLQVLIDPALEQEVRRGINRELGP